MALFPILDSLNQCWLPCLSPARVVILPPNLRQCHVWFLHYVKYSIFIIIIPIFHVLPLTINVVLDDTFKHYCCHYYGRYLNVMAESCDCFKHFVVTSKKKHICWYSETVNAKMLYIYLLCMLLGVDICCMESNVELYVLFLIFPFSHEKAETCVYIRKWNHSRRWITLPSKLFF